MTQSEALAAFALGVRYDTLPREVLSLAKDHFLDVLGIAIAAAHFDFGTAVLAGARDLGDGSAARAIGSGRYLPAPSAALVNGTLGHGLDFDDTHVAGIYHASAPAFAASLAAGEASGANGAAVLVSYIVALEIGCRLAVAAEGAFQDRGFHATSLCGTFAAATAAARLFGDNVATLVNALGLCGSQASGILEIRESWLKRLHPGWAAHAGLVATALSRHGFRGPATVFEGPHGFYATHIGKVPSGQQAPAHQLGEHWAMLDIAVKPYPCCHFIHSFIDAALVLRGQLKTDEIDRIDCFLTDRLQPIVGEPRERKIRPPTIYDALFSVPYVIAVALLKGRVDLASFYDEPLDAPDVLGLAERIFCTNDPDSDFPLHFPGEIRIRLKDGRELRRREFTSRGTPERRLSADEIEAKFRANATRAISPDQVTCIISLVRNIENLSNIQELVDACVIRQENKS